MSTAESTDESTDAVEDSAEKSPLLSAWLLGIQLREAREASGHPVLKAATEVDKHQSTVRRWEGGELVPGKLELRGLCEFYDLPADQRRELRRLQQLAAEPGWWNSSGNWPDATVELLNMEIAGIRIRSWDLTAIPGLLQTPEYARLVIQATEPNISPTQLDASVDLRMKRQAKVFDDGGQLREAIYIIDESALKRMPGGAAVRRAQITQLLAPPPKTTIQVLPFDAGPHPALGSYIIFDFDSRRLSTGVYIEGSVIGRALTQKGNETDRKEIDQYEQVWERLQGKALSPKQTIKFLEALLRGIE